MTGFVVTTQVGKARTEESRRITNMTPKRVELDDGVYARCEFSFSYGTVVVDLEFPVIADMLAGVFHDYMPTMDAVHRFMMSNPKTSADMLAEIQSKKSPASEGTAAMSDGELDKILQLHCAAVGYRKIDPMLRIGIIAAMFEVARITRERGEGES